jgi:hypothetical protein
VLLPRVRAPRRRGGSGSRAPWVIAAVIAFVIADIVLVAFALSSTRASTPTTVPETLPTISITPRATATPTPAPAPTPATVNPASFLVATSPTTAWRATAGLCGVSEPVIESTADAGVTWTPHSLGNQAVHEIVALSATTGDAATIVAKTGADCLVTALSTFTAGQFWQAYPERLVDQSFISPANAGVLQLQGSAMNAPCPVVLSLEVVSGRPAVLCSDAISLRSATTTEWVTTSSVGAKAFTVNGSRVLVAATGVTGCAGIAIQSFTLPLTAAASPTLVGCAASASPTGPAALDETGQAVWLTAGGVTTISTDGGSTW